jgi:hypothetical protein
MSTKGVHIRGCASCRKQKKDENLKDEIMKIILIILTILQSYISKLVGQF